MPPTLRITGPLRSLLAEMRKGEGGKQGPSSSPSSSPSPSSPSCSSPSPPSPSSVPSCSSLPNFTCKLLVSFLKFCLIKNLVRIQQSQNLLIFYLILQYICMQCTYITVFINPQSRDTLVQKRKEGKGREKKLRY